MEQSDDLGVALSERPTEQKDAATGVWLALDPQSCVVCGFSTRVNGLLQHDPKCKLRGTSKVNEGKPVVTDAMRQAAWMLHPNADAPYTEIYWAMNAVAVK